MARFERMRDAVTMPLSADLIRQRTAAGWQMVSIEWRRECPDLEAPEEAVFAEEIPYGLRIAGDCQRLEMEPREHAALMEMMEGLAQDFPYSAIVSALNEKGFRQRNGRPWTQSAIFTMLPRLIEVGPSFFSSQEWQKRRRRFEDSRRPEPV